jgi:hypothetical protein
VSLTDEEIVELTRRRTVGGGIDLSPYRDGVNAAAVDGGWGKVELESSDTQRTVKRRMTVAGKELGQGR